MVTTPDAEADAWVERAAGLGEAVIPRLVELLKGDAPGCVNAEKALAKVVSALPDDDRKRGAGRSTQDGVWAIHPGGRRSALGWPPRC